MMCELESLEHVSGLYTYHPKCDTVCAYTQVNAVLLTISLVSLAKSQCGMASKMESNKDEKRQKYMDVGK